MAQLAGGILREISTMKILTIGPSPHMAHDPGRIVRDFILCASRDHDVVGCFYHHDFTKHPIDFKEKFIIDAKHIESIWVDPQKENGAVIDSYDMIMDFCPESIVSFGGFFEAEFIRAAIETSGKNIEWHHVMTTSSHVHDSRFSETFNSIGKIWSYSYSQVENMRNMFNMQIERFGLIERSFAMPKSQNEYAIDVVFGGWNTEAYNFKSIFESLSGINASFLCLTNYYEYGDFDLEAMSRQYFSDKKIFPLDFGNLFELPLYKSWDFFIENCKVFIDMSMSQNGCSTLKRAIASNAQCLIIDTPRHRELARLYENVKLIKSSAFFSSSGLKLYIPDHIDLHLRIDESLMHNNKFSKKLVTHKEILANQEEEFNNLLNNLLSIESSGRFIGLESIT